MKAKLILIALVGVFSLSSLNVQAGIEDPGKRTSQLRQFIIEKVEQLKHKFNHTDSVEVHVCFQVDENGVIDVQDVISKNTELAEFLKENIDGETLNIDMRDIKKYTSYWITLDYTVL